MTLEVTKKFPKPISKRQWFYTTSTCDVTLFGGAAGSGKSEIGVIDFLKYIWIQNFIGVITRRTTPQLKGAGGILAKLQRTLASLYNYGEDYIWKEKDNKFVFYKRDEQNKKYKVSEIFLKHFEYEKDHENWQGVEANLFLIDEATQFTQFMVQYIMSRMRNPSCPSVNPHLKLTCNPDADHFLREWVEPYLNEDGTPDRNKDGLIRYFTYDDGNFCWGDSIQDVVDKSGCETKDVLSFTFISANVYDNKIVQEINPKYVAWLKGLRGVEKQRLLYGNWKVREGAGSYFSRKNVNELIEAPAHNMFSRVVRAYDFAGTLPSEMNRSPDYTASVKMGKLKTNGRYTVLAADRHRIPFGMWEEYILDNAARDGNKVEIILPQDPNPMAKAETIRLAKRLIEAGYIVTIHRSGEGKLQSFRPFAAAAHIGVVDVVKNCGTDHWNKLYSTNEFFYTELETFTGERKGGEGGHDDLVDCCSLGFATLASKFSIPSGFISGLKSVDLTNNNPLLNIRQ